MTDSQATIMTELAIESGAVFFHTPEFKEFAALRVDGHVETMALKGQAVRRWLASLYRQATGGAVPGSQAIQDALTALQGRAVYEGDEEDVHIRIAGHEGAIYVDLGDRDWQVVKISAAGWEVLDVAPVYFRRTRGMLPLPEPEPGIGRRVQAVPEHVVRCRLPSADDDPRHVLLPRRTVRGARRHRRAGLREVLPDQAHAGSDRPLSGTPEDASPQHP